MRRFLAALCLLVGTTLCGALAQAACELSIALEDSDKLRGLDRLANALCLGEAADTMEITRRIDNGLADVDADAASVEELTERRDALLELLDLIDGSLITKAVDMPSPWRDYAAITRQELATVRGSIADFASQVPAERWRHEDYGYFAEGGEARIRYAEAIDAVCPAIGAEPECVAAVEAAATLRRHIKLGWRVLYNEVRRDLGRLYTELVRLDSEWDYYFNEARSQFWWEFMLNKALYDPAGNQLARPPAGQLIVLHPNAAMEYVEGDVGVEESYNAVAIIELIGYNRLRWGENAPYSKWPLGASLVATYTAGGRADHWGYGALLHVRNNWSVGATRRDTGAGEETNWLFSVDLTKLFLKKSADARKIFRKLQR